MKIVINQITIWGLMMLNKIRTKNLVVFLFFLTLLFLSYAINSQSQKRNNSSPVANTGIDKTVEVGSVITLNGSGSTDLDGDLLTFRWTLADKPIGSEADLSNESIPNPQVKVDLPGDYTIQLIVNDGISDSDAGIIKITTNNSQPYANAGLDQTMPSGSEVQLNGLKSTDPDDENLSYYWEFVSLPENSSAKLFDSESVSPSFEVDQEGEYVVELEVNDENGNTNSDIVVISTENTAPFSDAGIDQTVLNGSIVNLDAFGSFDFNDDNLNYRWSIIYKPYSSSPELLRNNSFNPSLKTHVNGHYIVQLIVSDGITESIPDTINIFVRDEITDTNTSDSNGQNIDNTLEPSSSGNNFYERIKFLFEGKKRVQHEVKDGAINNNNAAVIRGKVITKRGAIAKNVKVYIKDHPEFGYTKTRENGWFDIVVNFDGLYTVVYEKQGYLKYHRKARAEKNDFVIIDEIAIAQIDSRNKTFPLGFKEEFSVVKGHKVNDKNGNRQPIFIVSPDTQANLIFDDGKLINVDKYSSFTITEITEGKNIYESFPAIVPDPRYVYSFELKLTDTKNQKADLVKFTKPISIYVDNFMNYPVGHDFNAWYYDRLETNWIKKHKVHVLKIISINNGLAIIDIDGDDKPDNPEKYQIPKIELKLLAEKYIEGKTLLRSEIDNMGPWVFICRPVIDDLPSPPPGDDDDDDDGCGKSCCLPGCIIDPNNQSVGESIPLVGTPYNLVYNSERVNVSGNRLKIKITGDEIEPFLESIELAIDIAGSQHNFTFPLESNIEHLFEWDGLDVFGRTIDFARAKIKIYYTYTRQGNHLSITDKDAYIKSSFPDNSHNTVYRLYYKDLYFESKNINSDIGAWSINIHHHYDVERNIINYGDATSEVKNALGLNTITRVVEGVSRPYSMTFVNSDLYFISGTSLYKANSDGNVENIDLGDVQVKGVVWSEHDNVFYVADSSDRTIKSINLDGTNPLVVAGGGTVCTLLILSGHETCPDEYNGPATDVRLSGPSILNIGSDNKLYFAAVASASKWAIARLNSDGTLTKITNSIDHNNFSLYDFHITQDNDIILGEYGSGGSSIFNRSYLTKLSNTGVRSIIAGVDVQLGLAGDGGPAEEAKLVSSTRGITTDLNNNIYFTDALVVRVINPEGTINTIAGGGTLRFARDNEGSGKPAKSANLSNLWDLIYSHDGYLYMGINNAILKMELTSSDELMIPSDDHLQLFIFNNEGTHLRTIDAITGAEIYLFEYDSDGFLISITDRNSNITTIQRNGSSPSSITSSYGQITSLSVNPEGYLTQITNPANESYNITYNFDGLITQFTNPRGSTNTLTYDEFGNLQSDTNALGGGWNLSSSNSNNYDNTKYNGNQITNMQSGEGLNYYFEKLIRTTNNGGFVGRHIRLINTFPDGSSSERTFDARGKEIHITQDGTATINFLELYAPYLDPRFGDISPYIREEHIITPSGRKLRSTIRYNVELDNIYDPLSHTNIEIRKSIAGYRDDLTYNSATRTWNRKLGNYIFSNTVLDDRGRISQHQITGLDPVDFTYDSNGRISSISQGTGEELRTTTLGYDSNGFLNQIINAENETISFINDLAGRVTNSSISNNETTFSYDANGNLTELDTPNLDQHDFTYNLLDYITAYIPPIVAGLTNVTTTYDYNLDNQITTITRPDGKTIVNSLNATTGQLTSTTISRGTYNYFYDAIRTCFGSTQTYPNDLCVDNTPTGQVTRIVAPGNEQLDIEYDGFLNTKETWSGTINAEVIKTYTNRFFIQTLKLDTTNTNRINHSYNAQGLLTRAKDIILTRDNNNGLITKTRLSNNINTFNTYNGIGEIVDYTARTSAAASGPIAYQATYQRDKLGRVTQKDETIETDTAVYDYTYDILGRLTEVQNDGSTIEDYTYDANGNRTVASVNGVTVTAIYDDQDRLLSYGSNTYTYNANGDLVTKTDTNGTTTYDYDEFGNLITVDLPDGTEIEYVIDGLNRRIGKKVDGILEKGWIYKDQLNQHAEYDGSGNLVNLFVYGEKTHVPDYFIRDGANYRIISDQVGSVRLVINASTKEIVQRIDYDSFGNVIQDTNPGFQPFGFAGGLYDSDTGLTRFGARDYDPEVGRWTIKDPILFEGDGPNLYSYVFNDAINLFDPNGLNPAFGPMDIPRPSECLPGPPGCKLRCSASALANAHWIIQTACQVLCILLDPTPANGPQSEDDPIF